MQRFETPSRRALDRTVGANELNWALSGWQAQSGTGPLLSRVAEVVAPSFPAGSRPIATILIGFGAAPAWWEKGEFDPDKHPRWPAKTPGSVGGQFRGTDAASSATEPQQLQSEPKPPQTKPKPLPSVPEVPPPGTQRQVMRQAADRAKQLAARRLARELALTALRGMVEAVANLIPVVDVVADALLLADIARTLADYLEYRALGKAVDEFIRGGPYTVEQLRLSPSDESFSSYGAFRKDAPDVSAEKRFGPAGDGYQYHHIVPQGGSNAQNISPEQLHSTENIIKIPTLLHEAINARYAEEKDGTGMTLFQWLQTQPYEVQRAEGLRIMRELGIIY